MKQLKFGLASLAIVIAVAGSLTSSASSKNFAACPEDPNDLDAICEAPFDIDCCQNLGTSTIVHNGQTVPVGQFYKGRTPAFN